MALPDLEDVENATIRKWAAMWRSIVTLSVMKHTYLPYYSYIHYLDRKAYGTFFVICTLTIIRGWLAVSLVDDCPSDDV